MTHSIRIAALASLLAGASLTAHAGFTPLLTLDFEALGQLSIAAPDPHAIAVIGQFSGVGVTFSANVTRGAWAYGTGTTGSAPSAGFGPSLGFIRNFNGDLKFTSIEIILGAGTNFDLLTFDSASSHSFDYEIVGSGGDTKGGSISSSSWQWVHQDIGLEDASSNVGPISSIVFTTGTNRLFALDNITFGRTAQPGGTVPEPASFGLVGLALLAAGAASKRRKSV